MNCHHTPCTCTVDQDQDYCSPHCAEQASASDTTDTCGCGHADCRTDAD